MNLIEWNEKYSVGIETFDLQHKKLVEILNKLNDAMSQGKSKDILAKVLTELIDYAKIHFKSEEDFFKKVDYKDSESHTNSHKAFVFKVLEFDKKFKSNNVGVSIEIMNFLKDWLLNHILVEDKKYSSYK